jgi:hypothetical protein
MSATEPVGIDRGDHPLPEVVWDEYNPNEDDWYYFS